jgi:serine/threonine protein kinase
LALTPGTRLGVYEVTTQLGVGGMGEVYRAKDIKLKRQVAIKILPPSLAADLERLARFQREAEVLASLNHPHIAGIYGLEESRSGGSSDPPTTALVMELVEGEDLSQRIVRGAIPLDEALPIAKQIAEALEAAHEQRIIHRDLKPANIKVRADGTVKVLDFGLAKAMDVGSGGSSGVGGPGGLSMSPTMPAQMSGVGVILGTAAYMAPEQAKGRTVDKRADIWAFGVVVYEMLTGRAVFAAEDVSETLAAVLTRTVDLAALPAVTPPRVRRLLARCLDRDPRMRLRDIGEARIEIEKAIAGVSDGATPPTPESRVPNPVRILPWIAVAVAAVMIGALAVPAVRHLRETPLPETRVDLVTPPTRQPASFALSPDGRQIVFVASDDKASRLWLRLLSTTTPQPLAGTEGATFPFWSPNAQSIGFFAGGALKRLDLGGGTPRTLAPAANGSGGTWNVDDVIVFAPSTTGPLMRVSAAGGAAMAVTTLGPQQFGHLHPQFLPDGRRLLFRVGGATDVSGIYLGGLDESPPTRLTSALTSGVYAPAGWLLWVRAGALTAQRLDVERPALTGEPVTLADGVTSDSSSTRSAVSVAANGLIAFRTSGAAQRQLTWFDRSGTARGVVGGPEDLLLQPRVSPDGRRVAVARTVPGQGNQEDIWLFDGARASRFTFDPGQDYFHVWSPDSTRIVYLSRRTGIGDLHHKLTSGAGVEEAFLKTGQNLTATSWSEDGRFLMYNSIDPTTNADIWVVPTNGNAEDRKPFVFLKTPFREVYGAFSPDGRWVAYHSNESGQPEVYVRPFVPPGATGTAATAAGGQWQISSAGGILPVWRSDGKELYYVSPDGAMMAAPMNFSGTTVEPGAPVVLFPTRMFGGGADIQLGRQYDVTRDGRFLINTVLDSAAAPITLLQNWNPEAKR